MGIKVSEVSDWLRKCARKRDHHELMPEDYVCGAAGTKLPLAHGPGQPIMDRTSPAITSTFPPIAADSSSSAAP